MLQQRDRNQSIFRFQTSSRRGPSQAYLPGMITFQYVAKGDTLRLMTNLLREDIPYETWEVYEDWSPSEAPVYLAFPVEESEDLPSIDQAKWVSTILDNDELREYATELGAAAVTACKTGDLELLAEALVDWHATAEVLADEEIMRELQESNDEKGRSWREIRESFPTR